MLKSNKDSKKEKKEEDVKQRIDVLNDDSFILNEFVDDVKSYERKHGKSDIGVIHG